MACNLSKSLWLAIATALLCAAIVVAADAENGNHRYFSSAQYRENPAKNQKEEENEATSGVSTYDSRKYLSPGASYDALNSDEEETEAQQTADSQNNHAEEVDSRRPYFAGSRGAYGSREYYFSSEQQQQTDNGVPYYDGYGRGKFYQPRSGSDSYSDSANQRFRRSSRHGFNDEADEQKQQYANARYYRGNYYDSRNRASQYQQQQSARSNGGYYRSYSNEREFPYGYGDFEQQGYSREIYIP